MRRLPSKSPTECNLSARHTKGSSSTSEGQQARGDAGKETIGEEAGGYIDLTLISAQGLKDVRMFGSMSPYAVVWIHPNCKHHTSVAANAGSSPVWDYPLRLSIPGPNTTNTFAADDNHQQTLTIQIFNHGAASDTLVGSVLIPLQDITQNAAGKLEYMACQVVRPSGRIQGLVNLSLRYTSGSSSSSLDDDQNAKLHQQQGGNRNSWFFLSQRSVDRDHLHPTEQLPLSLQGTPPLAAPDYLDFKDGADQGAGAGTASGSSSNASTAAGTAAENSMIISPHSPALDLDQFSSGIAPKPMFDNGYDALALADATCDLSQLGGSFLPTDASSGVGAALIGMAMSQPFSHSLSPAQGDSPSGTSGTN